MIENRNPNLRAHYDPVDEYGCQTRGHSYQTVVAFSEQGDAMVLDLQAGRLIPAREVAGFVDLVEVWTDSWEVGSV